MRNSLMPCDPIRCGLMWLIKTDSEGHQLTTVDSWFLMSVISHVLRYRDVISFLFELDVP